MVARLYAAKHTYVPCHSEKSADGMLHAEEKKHTLRVIARKGQMACYTDANKHTYIPCQCEKRSDGRLDADKHTYIPPQRELIT